jgi:hypothetical protein
MVNINWDNEAVGVLSVSNDVDDALVLFAGSINNRSIIGGIRPLSQRSFDIFNDVPAEIANGSFLLRAVRESVYRAKGSAVNDDDVIFARLVTYNRNDSSLRTSVHIDTRVSGEGLVYFENDSNLVLEIRLDSPTGERIATLPPFQRKKAVYLTPDPYGYTYYPTYVYYDDKQRDIRSITTSDLAQGKSMRPVVPGGTEAIPFVAFAKPNTGNIFAPVATLIVVNESSGGIFYRSGTAPQTSVRGNVMINSGDSETFELDMKQLKTREIGGLNIDPRQGEDRVLYVDPPMTYQAGFNYTLTIHRDASMTWSEDGAVADANKLEISLVNEY